MREIIFDTETTGFDHQGDDRMVEIGCIEMVDRMMTGQTYHCYYNPERAMPEGAQKVHGLSDTFLSDKPRFKSKVSELLEFIGDSPLIAHNAAFDFGFLNRELARIDMEPVSLDRMIDTVAIARSKHPGAKLSLDALCTRYGIDRSHRVKHGALLDAELLAHVYIELTGGRQIGFGLDTDDSIAAATGDPDAAPTDRPFRRARPQRVTEDELARHAAFIADIDGAIWNSNR